jgi:hypothetical protein
VWLRPHSVWRCRRLLTISVYPYKICRVSHMTDAESVELIHEVGLQGAHFGPNPIARWAIRNIWMIQSLEDTNDSCGSLMTA